MQNISSDNPQYVLHRFVLWFSLLAVLFFIGLFSLRQDPVGLKIQSFYVPYQKKHLEIPIYFSQDVPTKEMVVETDVEIADEFQQVALLIKRPLAYVDVYWDEKNVYQTPVVDGNRQGNMSVLIPLEASLFEKGTHHLKVYVSGDGDRIGLIEHIYVGEHEQFISYLKHRTSAAIFMISVLLLTTFFNLTRYVLYPHRNIFFAFGMLFLGFFLVSFSSAEIFFLFYHSVEMMDRVKTASMTVGIGSSMWVLLSLFPEMKHQDLLRYLSYLCILLFLGSFVLPLSVMQILKTWLYILSLPYTFFVLYLFFKTKQEWSQDVKYIVSLSMLIVVGGVLDLFAIWGFHQLPPSIPMFSTVFSIGATIYLSLVDSDLANRYAQMLSHTKDSVLICRQDGIILESNPIAKQLYSLNQESNLIDFVNEKEEMKQYLQQNLSDRYEFSYLVHDKKIAFESICVELPTGKLLLTLRDITSRKILEQEVLKRTKQDTLALVVGGIAHDFNNSLAAIVGQVQFLYPLLSKTEHARIQMIEDLVISSSKDVLEMLSLIRGTLESPYVQDLIPILEKNNAILQQMMSNSIRLHFNTDVDSVFVFMSATDIQLALLNITQNAVETLNDQEQGDIWVDVWCTSTQVCIHIENSGDPIPQDIQQHIFEPFYTTKTQNHIGIGLTVSQRIIEEHNGNISLQQNKYGSGGCFGIQLPLQSETSKTETQIQPNILLVEDEMLIREMLVEILEDIGYIVYACKSSKEALDFFEQHDIDLLITDVILQAESGIELATELSKRKEELLVLVVSGFIPDFEHQLDASWSFLQKPFQVQQFLNLVQEIIKKQQKNTKTI